jgi:signal transduction histidine kinase
MANRRDMMIAVVINLGLYTYLVFFPSQPSPLQPSDYFANPSSALFTIYMSHFIIIGVTSSIRHEQQLHYEVELLVEQQRVDILRQFLGHSSHDLRTMLTRILSNIYLIKRKSPEAELAYIERLEGSVNDLEKLLISMLDMARLDDVSQFRPMFMTIDDLVQDLGQVYLPKAQKKSQTLELVTDSVGVRVHIDLQHMTRAIGNILENAIIHTPENNTITMTTHCHRNQVIIKIIDTGVGIPSEQLPLIFDSFYRGDKARNQSTGLNGLGLAISKKIIEGHGGTLYAESELEIGSTFLIYLPIAR